MADDPQQAADELPATLRAWFDLAYDEEALWQQLVPGPRLDAVAQRISSTPGDFLDDRVDVVALAGDVLGSPDSLRTLLPAITSDPAARAGAAVALWLFASQTVVAAFEPPVPAAVAAIAALGLRLAPVVPAQQWLTDVTRREEAARLFLLWCGRLPADETVDASRAMSRRLDSLARDRALAAMATEHAHRLEVQRRLREQRAAEAASRYTHE